MSIWLEAAKGGQCQTDTTDITDRTPEIRVEGVKKPAAIEVPSVLSVCQFDRNTPNTSTHLPTEPPMCAVCGEQDWRVSVTEPDGRKVHVRCQGGGHE